MPSWWATVRLSPERTEDRRLQARSAWNAGWLARQLWPGVEVLLVRRVRDSHPHQDGSAVDQRR